MYKALQQQVQPRMLLLLLVSLSVMAISASYLYVIKKPFQTLRQSEQTLSLLQDEVQSGIPLQSQIQRQQQLVADLNIKLRGTGPKLPLNQMVAYVIGELDHIASRHQITLSSVRPENATSLFTFQELPFHVEVLGDYFSLFAWLTELEQELGPIVIKEFALSPIGKTKQRKMVLTIVAYQFEEKHENH